MRNDDFRERLEVDNITERCRKAILRWFGHVKRRDEEYVGRKTGYDTTWEKKKRKAETEMDVLCQPRHDSYRDNKRWSPRQKLLEENCVTPQLCGSG